MAKLTLIKNNQLTVTEEKKGRQIAVKESNITSLKDFYYKNYQKPITPPVETIENNIPEQIVASPDTLNTPVEPSPIVTPVNTPIIEEQPVITPGPIPPPAPESLEQPIINPAPPVTPSASIDVITPNPIEDANPNGATSASPIINLVPENNNTLTEDMDPELKEIKDRLDKVIQDLNDYKKKIKILETEVNQNLEKSREMLKDTQAAATIMSIQQERQRQITEEINNGATIDPTKTLQKDVA